MENFDLNAIYDLAVTYGLKILLTLVVLIIGLWIIKAVLKALG